MDKPKVSVCIVTYNQEAFIRDAIEGALMQKDVDYEIIIAEDCSTDHTAEICRMYRDKYPDKIRLIEQNPNKGIIGNTKDCLLAAKGEYIAICEGDDYWTDSIKLKKQVDILDNSPEVSLVHTGFDIHYIYEDIIVRSQCSETKRYICEERAGHESVVEIMSDRYRCIRFSSTCFRNKLLKQAISEHEFIFSERYSTLDIVIFYEMAFRGIIHYLDDSTTLYRLFPESVSSTHNPFKRMRYSLGIANIHADYLKVIDATPEQKYSILYPSFSQILEHCLNHGDKLTACKMQELAKRVGYKISFNHKILISGTKYPLLGKALKAMISLKRLNLKTKI